MKSESNNLETFVQCFKFAATKYANDVAVCFEDEALTYSQLDDLSDRIAAYIQNKNPKYESLIGIFQRRSVNYVASLLGVMKSGNVYVPIDPDTLNPGNELFPKERLRFMVEDTNTQFILTDEELYEFLNFLPCESIAVEDIYKYKSINPSVMLPSISSSTAAYGIYTSGSTGRPKITIVEHHSLINLYAGLDKYVFSKIKRLGEQIQVSINAPFGFDASLQQLVCLLNGHCIHIVPENSRRSVSGLIQFIQKKQIHILDCTPSQMNLLLRHGIFENCKNLRTVLVGGEAISPDTWTILEAVNNTAIFNVYGPTECCVDTTIALVNNGENTCPHIGKPIEGCRVFIVDENLNPVSEGEQGEIIIVGKGVARGYHNRPELNDKYFIDFKIQDTENPITLKAYRTGDIGRIDPNGNIIFGGRIDGQVKIRSHRIEIMEVASALKKFSKVIDCVVVVRGDSEYKELVAYIIPETKGTVKDFIEEIISHCKDILPTYMLPNHYIEIETIPLTANGKVNILSLPDVPIEKKEYDATESETEAIVGDIVNKILKTRIGRDENFMAVGGDSLRVMTLLAEIYIQFMVEIDYKLFFHSPTIAFIVNEIEKENKN